MYRATAAKEVLAAQFVDLMNIAGKTPTQVLALAKRLKRAKTR